MWLVGAGNGGRSPRHPPWQGEEVLRDVPRRLRINDLHPGSNRPEASRRVLGAPIELFLNSPGYTTPLGYLEGSRRGPRLIRMIAVTRFGRATVAQLSRRGKVSSDDGDEDFMPRWPVRRVGSLPAGSDARSHRRWGTLPPAGPRRGISPQTRSPPRACRARSAPGPEREWTLERATGIEPATAGLGRREPFSTKPYRARGARSKKDGFFLAALSFPFCYRAGRRLRPSFRERP